VKGICRFYLKQAHPRFELYVSPINIDPPIRAAISTPRAIHANSRGSRRVLHTGISEDTKARSAGVLDDKEYLQQSRTVLAEHRRIFDAEFPNSILVCSFLLL